MIYYESSLQVKEPIKLQDAYSTLGNTVVIHVLKIFMMWHDKIVE